MPDLGAYEGIDSVPHIFESGLLRMGEDMLLQHGGEDGAVPLSKSLREGQRLDADRAMSLLRSGLRAVRSLEAAGRGPWTSDFLQYAHGQRRGRKTFGARYRSGA